MRECIKMEAMATRKDETKLSVVEKDPPAIYIIANTKKTPKQHNSQYRCHYCRYITMASATVTRQTLRCSIRRAQLQTRSYSRIRPSIARDHLRTPALVFLLPAPRLFQSSARPANIKLPDGGEEPPTPEPHEETPSQKTEIAIEEYHQRADEFMEALVAKLEQRQETKGDMDVEYSVCGTYAKVNGS